MTVELSSHILERADQKFMELVTAAEISQAVNDPTRQYKIGQTLVRVKELPHRVRLYNGSEGHVIYAVVDKRSKHDQGRAVTLMIFGRSQKVQLFRPHQGPEAAHHIVRTTCNMQRYF